MLSRDEFVFTIGYDGARAVVDGQALRRCRSLSVQELAERGLFRAAWSLAVYRKDPAGMELVAGIYNRAVASDPVDPASFDRLFGVFPGADAAPPGNSRSRRPLVL